MSTESDFVENMEQIALLIQFETGIKAIVPITQAAHESRWGESELTTKANNLFGLTGDTWAELKKPVVYMKTREHIKGKWIDVRRPFRAYPSWEASLRDWARLMQLPLYAHALMWAKEGNVGAFATAVAAAGYATDPDYAAKLKGVAERVAPLLK